MNLLHGISIARGASEIIHLFFADGSILFTRANDREVPVLADILKRYEGLSGQKDIIDKREISLSKNHDSHGSMGHRESLLC